MESIHLLSVKASVLFLRGTGCFWSIFLSKLLNILPEPEREGKEDGQGQEIILQHLSSPDYLHNAPYCINGTIRTRAYTVQQVRKLSLKYFFDDREYFTF